MSIDLSKIEKSKTATDIHSMNILIYGQPKVGKTTLASKIEGALFLATEQGQHFVSVKKIDITDWRQVGELGAALTSQKDHGIRALVIDIADLFYKLCERSVMEKNKVEHASDLPYGKGFSLVRDEFTRVVTKLNATGVGLVFVSHAKEKTMKTKTAEWTSMATSMGSTPEGIIAGLCDIILYCYIDDTGKRMMRTKPTKYILAGDRSTRLPEIMPMDFDLLVRYFNGKQDKEDDRAVQAKMRNEMDEEQKKMKQIERDQKQENKNEKQLEAGA